MSRRVVNLLVPEAPAEWSPATKSAWNQLGNVIRELTNAIARPLIGRHYTVSGSIPSSVTLDIDNPTVTAVAHTLAKLLKDNKVAGIIQAEISG